MINGAHALIYSKDAEAVRAFLRDVLGFAHVDAGHGWLIFALPPSEVGVHPSMESGEDDGRVELHLMCDDIEATVAELEDKGVKITHPISDQGYGLVTAIPLPDGNQIGLYQPKHPTAI